MACLSDYEVVDIAGWESMYRSGERGREDAPTILLVETLPTLAPGSALDLACGTGRNALFLTTHGWKTTGIDGSETAIQVLRERAAQRGLSVDTQVADLASPTFELPRAAFDLIVIGFYLQRGLFKNLSAALRPGGVVLAIVHTPEPGETPTAKRAAPGELLQFFAGWKILHWYEGPSRDPAHRRPVAEIVAARVDS